MSPTSATTPQLLTSPAGPPPAAVTDPGPLDAAEDRAVDARAVHPAARPHLVVVPDLQSGPPPCGDAVDVLRTPQGPREEGSLVAEYGLLAVVAATIAGVLISWAGSGALTAFFGQLLDHARSLVVS